MPCLSLSVARFRGACFFRQWCVSALAARTIGPLAQRESGRLTCVRSLVQSQDGPPTIGGWCNGSTPDSDSGDGGSNPSSPANATTSDTNAGGSCASIRPIIFRNHTIERRIRRGIAVPGAWCAACSVIECSLLKHSREDASCRALQLSGKKSRTPNCRRLFAARLANTC